MPSSPKYLNPRLLNKILPLSLRAQRIVEGFLGGLHKSPHRGISIEFAQHREYVPGDDIRFLDWKVFGRSDRYYIKEFEVETTLSCNLFLDTSESMSFTSEEVTKFDYAASIAAALAYLAIYQRDSASLVFFDQGVTQAVPPGNGSGHLKNLLSELEKVTLTSGTRTGPALHGMAERLQRRGIVVILSDLLDDGDAILSGLEHLRHNGHEVIVFHLLDRAEVDFPYERMTLFEGMEALPHLLVDPKDLRESYLRELKNHTDRLRRGCLRHKIDFVDLPTDTPLDVALVSYLGKRDALLRKGKH